VARVVTFSRVPAIAYESTFNLLTFFAFALGAIVGSFLNVVIHRYPLEESIVFPPSRCPKCAARIRWYDNVPILAYLWLLGRCRDCRAPISPRYPLVELANALFYLAIFLHTGPTPGFFLVAAFVSMIIVLIYIDAEIQILPDVVDLPGIAVGIAVGALALGEMYPALVLSSSIVDALAGGLFGAAVIVAVIGVYWLVRRVEGMGQGDIKMLAMIGAGLGWRAVPGVLLLAAVCGSLIGVPLALRSKHGMQLALPFGVFLGLATLAVLFFGHTLSAWYLSLLLR
jgi:leader peptidase (prepilin peptidase)/N-methyltransferase